LRVDCRRIQNFYETTKRCGIHIVRGHGSSKPNVFFIADSPHGEDLRTDYALTGYAGDLLRQYCKEQQLNLDEFYRTCLIKEKCKSEEPTALIEKYSPILIDEINTIAPNLLIPLGELSFNYLTQLRGIRKFRGSVLPAAGPFVFNKTTKILPILGPHPYLIQEYRLRPITRIDFSKIARNMLDTPIPDNLYNIWVARSAAALRAFLERHFEKTLKTPGGFLTFDIETYFQIPICISFCFDGFESVTIPFLDHSIDRDNRTLMMQMVAKVLASPIPKVNQNIKYDWKILERWNFTVANVIGDTMLGASALYCEFPKNLGFLTSIYTDLPYFKDEGKEFDPEKGKRDRYYLYNAKDSLATSQIYSRQQPEIDETGVRYVYDSLMRCQPIYKKAECRGIRIDKEAQLKLLCKYESLFHIQELKLRQLTGRQYFNPLSPKQCKKVIFDEIGYTSVRGMKINKDGSPGTDEDSLDLLAAYGHPKRAPSTGPLTLETIIGARKLHKVIEILELHLHPDERFRCEFNLAGTENGRTSGGQTTDQFIYLEGNKVKVTNLGHSLQTIGKHGFAIGGATYGKDLRNMFVPSPGMVFVELDLSQAEARVDAVLSGNFAILPIFDGPIGIHRLTGSWAYDCDPSEIKKNVLVNGVDRYHVAKQIRHSGERNIQAETLRVKFLPQLTTNECARLLKVLHSKQPEIVEVFHKAIRAALDAPTHCLVAPNGRRRDFFDRIVKSTYNEGISFLPQAIVSDQTKFKGIVPTYEETKAWAWLLTEQHDGVLYETYPEKKEELARIYMKNVQEPIDFRFCTLSRDFRLVIPAEAEWGECWYGMEGLKL
jgi:uracil-DNA glycosylase family 4